MGIGTIYRRARRELQYLRGYFDFDRKGNEIVRRTDFTRCPRPVLLLYGHMATRRVFEVLEARLRRDGFGVFSVNLGGLFDAFNTYGIDRLAEKVRDKVERLYSRYELGPLSIIGHSKGGLIARYYVKRLGGDARVRTLITLGTPHNGTPSAYFGILTVGLVARDVWQMTPMSPFIRRLKMGAFPRHVRFTSIYSKEDQVSPFPCCILETNGQENLANVEVAGASHREYLWKRHVYDVIRRELLVGYGERPQPAPDAVPPLERVR
ncbi:MAG: alpha/beta hydrolase [Myxococcaceae bacterium]|nr:alpha/beta hydrolase [Myxococcaceae bacterium]